MDKQICALTMRKLKPGAWEAFRKGWDVTELGEEHPPFIKQIYHVRSVEDPDTVISFGIAEGPEDEMRSFFEQPKWRELDARRHAAMAPHVEETIVDGIFEVIDEVVPASLR